MSLARHRFAVSRRQLLGGALVAGTAARWRPGNAQDVGPTPVPIRVQTPDLAFADALQQQLRTFETEHASEGLVLSIVPAEPAADSLLNDLRLDARRFAGAFVPHWLLPDLVRDGFIAQASPPPQPLPPSIAQIRSFGGEWLASGLDHDCSLLYARRDLIERHNASVPVTWEDLIDLLDGTGLQIALPRTHAEQVVEHVVAMAACYVGDDPFWFDPESLEPALTSDAHGQAVTDWQRLSRHAVAANSTGDLWSSFADGSAAFLIASSDAFPFLLTRGVDADVIDVSQLPGKRASDGAVRRTGNLSGANWGGITVAGIAGHQQVRELLDFLAQPATQLTMAAELSSGLVPLITDPERQTDAFIRMGWPREATLTWLAALSATFQNPLQLAPLRIAETRRYLLAFQAHLETCFASESRSPTGALASTAADWKRFNDAIGVETQRDLYTRSQMPPPVQ